MVGPPCPRLVLPVDSVVADTTTCWSAVGPAAAAAGGGGRLCRWLKIDRGTNDSDSFVAASSDGGAGGATGVPETSARKGGCGVLLLWAGSSCAGTYTTLTTGGTTADDGGEVVVVVGVSNVAMSSLAKLLLPRLCGTWRWWSSESSRSRKCGVVGDARSALAKCPRYALASPGPQYMWSAAPPAGPFSPSSYSSLSCGPDAYLFSPRVLLFFRRRHQQPPATPATMRMPTQPATPIPAAAAVESPCDELLPAVVVPLVAVVVAADGSAPEPGEEVLSPDAVAVAVDEAFDFCVSLVPLAVCTLCLVIAVDLCMCIV